MTTEEENENTKWGVGGKVCFLSPLSSRLTIGYKHVSSSDVTHPLAWRQWIMAWMTRARTECNAAAGIRRPGWWHPRRPAPPPLHDRNGHHQTVIPPQTSVWSCSLMHVRHWLGQVSVPMLIQHYINCRSCGASVIGRWPAGNNLPNIWLSHTQQMEKA